MKGVYSFASLAILTLASEDVGPWRTSTYSETKQLINDPYDSDADSGSGIVWEIVTKSMFEEDTGNEYLRIEHTLTANIKATDDVIFEIGFTTGQDPWENKMSMAYDVATCKLEQSTQDSQFWVQSV